MDTDLRELKAKPEEDHSAIQEGGSAIISPESVWKFKQNVIAYSARPLPEELVELRRSHWVSWGKDT